MRAASAVLAIVAALFVLGAIVPSPPDSGLRAACQYKIVFRGECLSPEVAERLVPLAESGDRQAADVLWQHWRLMVPANWEAKVEWAAERGTSDAASAQMEHLILAGRCDEAGEWVEIETRRAMAEGRYVIPGRRDDDLKRCRSRAES